MSRLCCSWGERTCCRARFCVCCIPCPAIRRVYRHGRPQASDSTNACLSTEVSSAPICDLHLSVHHDPIDRAIELQNLFKKTAPFVASNGYEIRAKTAPNPPQRVFLVEGRCRIHRYHFQNLIGRNCGLAVTKRAHLVEQAQALVTRQAICTQGNVESKGLQSLERKSAVLEVIVTARRMHHTKSYLRFFQQLRVTLGQFIQMRDDPLWQGATAGRI